MRKFSLVVVDQDLRLEQRRDSALGIDRSTGEFPGGASWVLIVRANTERLLNSGMSRREDGHRLNLSKQVR